MLSLPEPSQQRYLEGLDAALGALESHLQAAPPEQEFEAITNLARREGWDWRRLPSTGSYRTLAGLIARVRREYRWFRRRRDGGLSLDPASGLPWSFSLIELEQLQRSGPTRLAKLPSFEHLASELRELLEGDTVDLEDVPRRASALHDTALRRSFLVELCEAQLLGWQANTPCSPPLARKLLDLGHEQLWSVALLRYRPEDSLFVAYVVHLWSDDEEAILGDDHAEHSGISEELEQAFRFGVETPAWFVLQRLDERFPRLHPVHVSRGIIGPYWHNFDAGCDDRELPAIADVLHHEAEIGVLRFTRQYAFAPHRRGRGDERRQQVYRRNWHEEIYACPGRHAARLARAVLGTQARVVKA